MGSGRQDIVPGAEHLVGSLYGIRR